MAKFYNKSYFAMMFACLLCMGTSEAVAQIGPDLRPPGLDADHHIASYSGRGKKATGDDWRHENSWELNTNDVVFSASKKRQLISEAPSTIHVLTDRDIASHGWRTLSEMLRHVPGVQTLTTQSGFQSVMIRGLVGTENNNARILWLQNGVPINDVRDSGIWLDETYPVELIKRVEVVLGPGSALYGSGAFQGVVNIFTKDPKDIGKYGEYRIAAQNNMTFKASAVAAYNSDDEDFGLMLHVSGNTTQGAGLVGDYVYQNYLMDTASLATGDAGDPTYLRLNRIDSNSDKHWYSINAKFNYKSFKWQLGFSDIYAGADGSEISPNIAYNATRVSEYPDGGIINEEVNGKNYRFNRREFYSDFFYEDDFGDSVTFLSLLSYRFMQYNHEHYNSIVLEDQPLFTVTDPYGKTQTFHNNVSALPTGYEDKVNFDTYQHKLYALAQTQWHIYENNELIGGVVAEFHHIQAPELGNETPIIGENGNKTGQVYTAQKLSYITPSLFLQDEQRFWGSRIILTVGGRVDFYEANLAENKIAPSWRAAFLAKWTEWLTMRLSYGYAFKEPSLFQLYADTFDYTGTPTLKNESLHNIELSFVFNPTYYLSIRLDGFATFMSDLIRLEYVTSPTYDVSNRFLGLLGKYKPVQDSDANILGFELSLNSKIGTNWNIYANYNFLYSKRKYEDGSKEDIKDDAMHRGKIGFSYLDENVTADLALFLVSSSPDVASSRINATNAKYHTPFYAIVQPHVTVGLPANLGFMVQGSYAFSENMFSSPTYRYYYETEGVPVNRYSVMFSLIYPFRNVVDE
ncbi:MAG: TonB-dependent receptor [Proteobacteria bacterium]|nr:TonB-dependent receptor [Pseudomonadota bacterium]